jgi:hypothetical protein
LAADSEPADGRITWAPAHISNEAETMRNFLLGLLSGTFPGVALAILLESSPSLEQAITSGEAFYQGRPTSSWLWQIQDQSPMFRLEAVQALEKLGPQEPSVVPKLGEMLKDTNSLVRLGVSGALRRLGACARPALPALLAGLDDVDQYVRCNVVAALGHLEPRDQTILAALTKASEDKSQTERWMALRCLEKNRPGEKEASSMEPEAGADRDSDVRGETADPDPKR